MDKTVGIAAIATLLAGAGYLLKEGKTTNMSAENQVFMATGRAISSKKINKSFFNKQLPSILTKAQTDKWNALDAKATDEGLWNEIDRREWQKYDWLVSGGQKTYPLGERETAYGNLAQQIDSIIAFYYQDKAQQATQSDLKKATTQLLKVLNSSAVSNAFKNNMDANGNPTRLTQIQFQNGVFGRLNLNKVATLIEDASVKYNDILDAYPFTTSPIPNYPLSVKNLLDKNSMEGRYFSNWLYNACSDIHYYGRGANSTKEALLQNLTSYFNSRMRNNSSPYLNNPLRADQNAQPPTFTLTPEVKKFILDYMDSTMIVRWYQYTQFFKENPEIKVVGVRTYPYSQRKESYFKEYTRRKNTQFYFALPPSFGLSESEMKSYLGREARKAMAMLEKEMQPARTRRDAKKQAANKSIETAQKEYIKVIQKALDGKKIMTRNQTKPLGEIIPVESRVDMIFNMLTFPNSNANYLTIVPSKMIKQYHARQGVMEEYEKELGQCYGMVKMSYLFENLTIPPSLYDKLEAKLLERKDAQIRSADDQIARIAAQMQQPLNLKADAQKQYYERRAVLMDKLRQQNTP